MLEIIMMIDEISFKIAKISLILVILKYVTKRIRIKKIDNFFMRIHKPATNILLISSVVHAVTSFSKFSDFSIWVYVIGFVCFLSIIGAVYAYVARKKLGNSWIKLHRFCTVVAFITFFVHPRL